MAPDSTGDSSSQLKFAFDLKDVGVSREMLDDLESELRDQLYNAGEELRVVVSHDITREETVTIMNIERDATVQEIDQGDIQVLTATTQLSLNEVEMVTDIVAEVIKNHPAPPYADGTVGDENDLERTPTTIGSGFVFID